MQDAEILFLGIVSLFLLFKRGGNIMNEIIEKEIIDIENMIYEINGKEVMLDSEFDTTKCHDYYYNKIVTHYDIEKSISVFNALL